MISFVMFKVSAAPILSLHVKMASALRGTCCAMATGRAKMVQTKTIVNVLSACFSVRGEDASFQQRCATESMTVLTEMTKIIVVSWLIVGLVKCKN